MAGGNAIRGSRVAAGPMGETERGEVAPRRRVSFWCAGGHESRPSFERRDDHDGEVILNEALAALRNDPPHS